MLDALAKAYVSKRRKLPARRLPPPDPPTHHHQGGATGEGSGYTEGETYYNGHPDRMVPNKQPAPRKTTEGYEPWQWDADDPRRKRRLS